MPVAHSLSSSSHRRTKHHSHTQATILHPLNRFSPSAQILHPRTDSSPSAQILHPRTDSAPSAQILHPLHRFFTLRTDSSPSAQILHPLHRFFTLCTDSCAPQSTQTNGKHPHTFSHSHTQQTEHASISRSPTARFHAPLITHTCDN